MFKGSFVALVTPMHEDGQIDWPIFEQLIYDHLKASTSGIVLCGTTGESASLTLEEKAKLVKTAHRLVNHRIPIIVGTGAASTSDTIQKTQLASDWGADAALILVPPYVKPTQEGLYRHFRAIAESTPLPIILYNVPSRTACDLMPHTVARLSHLSNIVAIKEACNESNRIEMLLQVTEGRLTVLSGNDDMAYQAMLAGAKGVISVTANVFPTAMAQMVQTALADQFDVARAIDLHLQPLHRALFVETNPIPVKWALYYRDKISTGIRLPLTPLSAEQQPIVSGAIRQVLTHYEKT